MVANNNKPPFPYPMRGLGIILIFLVLAPLAQVFVGAFMMHDWVGGRQLLVEISEVFQETASHKVLSGYSIYMPLAVFAGAWCGYSAAMGRSLSFGSVVSRMVITGFLLEVLFQLVVVLSGYPLVVQGIIMSVVQWILSGAICWFAAKKFHLNKAVS